MSKHTVVMTRTVEVQIDDGVAEGQREAAAIVVAKFFLDHEEEEEEERKEDLPVRVHTQYVGTVVGYDWSFG
jgi:hypothetical protein